MRRLSGSILRHQSAYRRQGRFAQAIVSNDIHSALPCIHTPIRGCATQSDELEFKAETKKLLHIVTHSLYTDKEVFVRELISNASDSLEKLRYMTASGQSQSEAQSAHRIVLSGSPIDKTFTIEDNGIGMSRQELINNLGTIAKSGTQSFLKEMQSASSDAQNIIGQFGVGFYSSFVVSDRVEVFSRKREDANGWRWASDGSGTFTVSDAGDIPFGTRIVCHLKTECLEFANPGKIKECAQKFSNFIVHPLFCTDPNGTQEALTVQKAIWLNPSPSEEEHLEFFKLLAGSYSKPFYSMVYHADAPITVKAVLYVPEDPPNRLFEKAGGVGVSLHCRRVLVSKAADTIVPRWLHFLKGVIDCEDISLNVSREHMQDSKLMAKIKAVVVRRVLKFFEDQSRSDLDRFLTFYKNYQQYLKEGFLEEQQNGNDSTALLIAKLLRFETSKGEAKKLSTLGEYLGTSKEGQENMYYLCAPSREAAMASPYMEHFVKRDRNVLLLLDPIDEFVAMNLREFEGKKLVAVDSPEDDFEPNLDAPTEGTGSDESASLTEEQKTEVESYIKDVLGSRVTVVKFASGRLVGSPAIVTGFISATLQKMMKATLKGGTEAQSNMAKLPVTLELNPHHPIVLCLPRLMQEGDQSISHLVVEQLLDNACLAAGILEEPTTMLPRLNRLLLEVAQE